MCSHKEIRVFACFSQTRIRLVFVYLFFFFFCQCPWRAVVEELYPLLHINAFLTRPFQHAYITIIRSECGVGMLMCLLCYALFLHVPRSLKCSFIPTSIFSLHVTCPHWAKFLVPYASEPIMHNGLLSLTAHVILCMLWHLFYDCLHIKYLNKQNGGADCCRRGEPFISMRWETACGSVVSVCWREAEC